MAAPSATPRVTPVGIPLKDGHPTKITFAADTDVSFWERSITPPGVDGGDAIDFSTMFNTTYRTMTSRSLKTLTDGSATALYDPAVYTQIVNLINVETTITITFSDGSTLAFYGFLRSFEPAEITEGDCPEATVNFTPTNWDPVNNVEAGPTLVSVAGC